MNIKFDFQNLINKYSDTIYHIALGYLKNREDAEDLVQEVFLHYINYIKNNDFKDDNHEKCWIIRVTINLCRNAIKSKKNSKNVYLENEIIPDNFSDSENNLLDCIDSLKEKYRIVFELFYIKDFKICEISSILNISEANVKTRLKRARDKLKKMLQIGGEESGERF